MFSALPLYTIQLSTTDLLVSPPGRYSIIALSSVTSAKEHVPPLPCSDTDAEDSAFISLFAEAARSPAHYYS